MNHSKCKPVESWSPVCLRKPARNPSESPNRRPSRRKRNDACRQPPSDQISALIPDGPESAYPTRSLMRPDCIFARLVIDPCWMRNRKKPTAAWSEKGLSQPDRP